MKYEGEILGFHYMKEFETKEEFEQWLEAKLIKYRFKNMELKMMRKILGIDDLEQRIKDLELK